MPPSGFGRFFIQGSSPMFFDRYQPEVIPGKEALRPGMVSMSPGLTYIRQFMLSLALDRPR
jgi:hypothetical protein